MKAEILALSWVDRNDKDLPADEVEVRLAIRVKEPARKIIMDALRAKPEGQRLAEIEVMLVG